MKYETIIKSFEVANEFREVARVNQNQPELYLEASDKYSKAGIDYEVFIHGLHIASEKHLHKAFQEYYFFESEECLAAYNYEERKIALALDHNKNALHRIETTVRELILSKNEKELEKHLEIWKYFRENTILFAYNIKARDFWDKGLFVNAIDCYKTVLSGYQKIETKVVELTENRKLPQVFLRIVRGNYYGMKFNIASAHAAIITSDISLYTSFDGVLESLQIMTEAIELSKNAFKENPEWSQYKEGIPIYRENIAILLDNNREYWRQLINGMGNTYINNLMREIDENYYHTCIDKKSNDEEANVMSNNGFFKVLFSGLIIVAVISILYTLIVERVGVLGTVTIISAALILIAIISVIAFRYTNSISEEKYSELIKLIFKGRFNFLKRK